MTEEPSNNSASRPDEFLQTMRTRFLARHRGVRRYMPAAWRSRRTLRELARVLAGDPKISGIDGLRMATALGAISWAESAVGLSPIGATLDSSFAAFLYWPIVAMPTLPASMAAALPGFASEEVASLLFKARSALEATHDELTVSLAFARRLAHEKYGAGLVKVLDDLEDPGLGGPAFSAVYLLASNERVPMRARGGKEILYLLAGYATHNAMSGSIGNYAYDKLKDLSHLFDNTPATGASPSQVSEPGLDHLPGHAAHQRAAGSSLSEWMDALFGDSPKA